MNILKSAFSFVIDALFPISEEEKRLFSLSANRAFEILPHAPPPPISDCHSVFAYKDPVVTKLIWNIKYKKNSHALELGGYALYSSLHKFVSGPARQTTDKTILIPIPITTKRRKERGYNQCEILLEEIRKLDRTKNFITINDLLIRIHHQERQTLKDRSHRIEDAKGIFGVNATKLHSLISQNADLLNLQIIIIDDVVTTGSTMKDAIRVMRDAGFNNLFGLSLAH